MRMLVEFEGGDGMEGGEVSDWRGKCAVWWYACAACFIFQAEDGIRDLVRARGLGDVYKRQCFSLAGVERRPHERLRAHLDGPELIEDADLVRVRRCLLYTSDAADDLLCVDLAGRRIIKQKLHFYSSFIKTHHPPSCNHALLIPPNHPSYVTFKHF